MVCSLIRVIWQRKIFINISMQKNETIKMRHVMSWNHMIKFFNSVYGENISWADLSDADDALLCKFKPFVMPTTVEIHRDNVLHVQKQLPKKQLLSYANIAKVGVKVSVPAQIVPQHQIQCVSLVNVVHEDASHCKCGCWKYQNNPMCKKCYEASRTCKCGNRKNSAMATCFECAHRYGLK